MRARSQAHKTPSLGAAVPSAAVRLREALTVLTHPTTSADSPSNASAAELCRLAGVSRNSLYRYHSGILKALRQFQCRRQAPRDSRANCVSESLRTENTALRGQVTKLAALVDHYYAGYREASALLARRDRELASLHQKLNLKPLLLTL